MQLKPDGGDAPAPATAPGEMQGVGHRDNGHNTPGGAMTSTPAT